MNGADYIAAFLVDRGITQVYLMNGGACAFMIDAIGRNPGIDYIAMQHEQAAAMAADASWRVTGVPGVSLATSGPGATNLITGIACSYFDSIPSLHITGQVNMRESAVYLGASVRQAGFQETNIVDMVRPITKYAVQVHNVDELKVELSRAYNIAMSGRRGPVLIDVPMNVQQDAVGEGVLYDPTLGWENWGEPDLDERARELNSFLLSGARPLLLFGAGVGLSGSHVQLEQWLRRSEFPFVASWNALTYFDHRLTNYLGQIGVYGNRGANAALQNCDRLLVLGSRLDNRQRSGNPATFAPEARVMVLDIDGEELKKYAGSNYVTSQLDLAHLPPLLGRITEPPLSAEWRAYLSQLKADYYNKDLSTFSKQHGTISPYEIVAALNSIIEDDAIVIADTGATVCWTNQSFCRTNQTFFTAGGNSPMGYALPAAIGAALLAPNRQVICVIGDGGLQVNIQELQTIKAYDLNITIVVMNNHGYGIIKQFQDSYMEGRHEASGRGYSVPDLGAISQAYGLGYVKLGSPRDVGPHIFQQNKATLVEVPLHPGTLIEPKLEMGRPINDQFPYVSDEIFSRDNKFTTLSRRR
ncbi:thiamine pyrophosphate-binding protein [Bradyrhizobium sp. WD16]|uniref:thiamine pyrophosphate-binding protein n=1 Tax=Bradyrhizobium sp. WD16 TaxID=1521768 RepID=UPI0020A51DAA|nr:thiamine pyrophosphate-binding protein [Bradyrhizobium sp. WD16]UTD28412.1 acetolactate synthase [Bradyrhizobium sp. WD16]